MTYAIKPENTHTYTRMHMRPCARTRTLKKHGIRSADEKGGDYLLSNPSQLQPRFDLFAG